MTAAIAPDLGALIVPIDTVKPFPGNPRRGAIDALRKSLSRFGQQKPILVQVGTGYIVAGNQIWEAMKAEGATEIAAVWSSLSDTEARAYLVADNQMSALGKNDTHALMEWLGDLAARSAIDDALGFPREQVSRFLASLTYDPDATPEPVAADDSWVKVGTIYQIGRHRVACGDSTDDALMARLIGKTRIDAVYTDPPYGIGNTGVNHALFQKNSSAVKGHKYRDVAGDDKPFDPTPYLVRFAKVPEQFWWGANYYHRLLTASDLDGNWMVWDKRNETMDSIIGSGFELCWSRQKHKQMVFRYPWSNFTRMHAGAFHHPTEKPVALIEDMLGRWVPDGAVIIDPFAGSGSTMVACERSLRTCLMAELEPAYVQVIIERWQLNTGGEPEVLP
jgi:DNA modification methylase